MICQKILGQKWHKFWRNFFSKPYDKKHNLSSKNPVQLFGYNFVDQQKGFYNFRNQWINQDDFVANIFLKKELIGGTWHYPDVGSFRISGLGETWAKAGKSSNNWQE